jgi:hypothetical protein
MIAMLSIAGAASSSISSLRGVSHRQLATPYFSVTDPNVLGQANVDAAIGNPLKGLMTSPRWVDKIRDEIPASLEFYYFGLAEVMAGPNQFNWTVIDKAIQAAESRNNHVVWRFFIDYPGSPLSIPKHLVGQIKLVTTASGHVSPQYEDPILLQALDQFITAIGVRYNGHKTVAFLQVGLLGYWGGTLQ